MRKPLHIIELLRTFLFMIKKITILTLLLIFTGLISKVVAQDQLSITNHLQLWLKADAGVNIISNKVDRWEDQSKKGNHAVQTNPASQPILVSNAMNQLPGIQFNGTSNFLLVPDATGMDGVSTMSVLMAIKMQPTKEPRAFLAKWGSSLPNSWVFQTVDNQPGELRVFVASLANDGGSTYCDTLDAAMGIDPPQEFNVVTFIFNGSQLSNDDRVQLFSNGWSTEVRTTGTIKKNLIETTAPLSIGTFPSLGRYYNGLIFEIILYDSALIPTERQKLESYLRKKYTASAQK